MAETDKSLATRVQAHLRAAGKPVPSLPDIIPLIATGLEELAGIIAANRMRRDELRVRPAYALDVVDGEASLATLLAPPYRLLLDYLPQADVRDEQGNKLYYLGRDRYDLTQPNAFGYFTFEGNTFMARLAGEEPESSDFQAAISGNFVPSADLVPPSCVPDAVLLIARLISAVSGGK
jgi:hypothetical protein